MLHPGRKIRDTKKHPYWCSIYTAAKKKKLTKACFYNRYLKGAMPVVFPMNPKEQMGITWTELNYLYPDTQKPTARRKIVNKMFVGYAFRELAKECGEEWIRSLNDVLSQDKWFDGTVYLSDQAFYRTKEKTFRFVCSRIYEYNEIVKRHRPSQHFRHLILCVQHKKRFACKMKKKLDRLYPGVVHISSMDQVYKVQKFLCGQLKKNNLS